MLTNHHMPAPTNYTLTILNRLGNTITAPVVHVKDIGPAGAFAQKPTVSH